LCGRSIEAVARRQWTVRNLAAAATILVAVTAGITWSVAQRGTAGDAGLAASDTLPADTGFAAAMAFTQNARNVSRPAVNTTYEGEISALRRSWISGAPNSTPPHGQCSPRTSR